MSNDTDQSPESFEGFLQWGNATTLRCARIGLTPVQILAVQVLASLPEGEPRGTQWVPTPGVVWISGKNLARRLYASTTATKVRQASAILASLERGNYIMTEQDASATKAKRYCIGFLRDQLASVDVTDVFPKAEPPVPLPADSSWFVARPRAPRAPAKTKEVLQSEPAATKAA